MNTHLVHSLKAKIKCFFCQQPLKVEQFLFQGIHTCIKGQCPHCQQTIIADLPTGQALYTPYQVHIEKRELFGADNSKAWFGEPFLNSLLHPTSDNIKLHIEKNKAAKKIVFLNCLDYLYGHSLLKLFNLDAHIRKNQDVVVLCQRNLRWLVPKSAAEIWTVDLPFSKMRNYYPSLGRQVEKELERFSQVSFSPAYSHPLYPDIQLHTGFTSHDHQHADFRITFIVRDDRLWANIRLPRQLSLLNQVQRIMQYWKIWQLFHLIRRKIPYAQFTIAGMGRRVGWLPTWIDQQLFQKIDVQIEKKLCRIYSESRVVVGVHGSNMLLPSALAGGVVDLMPTDRWGNFAQDIIYRPNEDPRVTSFLRRYLPISVKLSNLAIVMTSMIKDYCAIMQIYQEKVGSKEKESKAHRIKSNQLVH